MLYYLRRDLLLLLLNSYLEVSHLLRRHRLPTRHPVRGCVLASCVQRDEQLAIHRPVYFATPAAGIVCYTAAVLLAPAS